MKTIIRGLAVSLLVLPLTLLGQPNTPDEFVAAYRAAIQEKSPAKIDAITYSVGMSESDKHQVALAQQMIFSDSEIIDITLAPLPGDFQSIYIMRGKKLEPTYPPVGLIQTKYKATGNDMNSTSVPYAVIDGRYFLTSTKSIDLGWSGPPDKTITFMVMGRGQDKVQIKAKWNASGVEQTRIFKLPSANFMGQYFDEITVASAEDDTDVTLTILEEGKEIYTSQPLKGKGSIEYKRKS